MKKQLPYLLVLCSTASFAKAPKTYNSLDELKKTFKIQESVKKISNITINNAVIDFALTGEVEFQYMVFTDVTFTQRVSSQSFTGSKFSAVTFNAPVEKSIFNNCDFFDTTFVGEVTSTNFTDAEAKKYGKSHTGLLFKAKVADCTFDKSPNFKKQLRNVTFEADIINCSFENAHLVDTVFTKSPDEKTLGNLHKRAKESKNVRHAGKEVPQVIVQHSLVPDAAPAH